MGNKNNREEINFTINPEKSNSKGTIDDESMYRYIEKERNATSQILLNQNNYSSGFFCKISFNKDENILLNVLLTCEHVIKQYIIFSNKDIKINLNDPIKKISLKVRKNG